jgi:hypothetical protein
MSQRPFVDRQRIERFLETLGRRFSRPGRVYLVGGTIMVYEGFRSQTLDIDLAYSVPPDAHAEFVRAVQELKHELAINVEEASPKDFIPLPSGYEERAKFIGRFGQLDVFHFDIYSVVLSKIERGRDADFNDALVLLKAEWLDFETLEHYFTEILPKMEVFSLKANPDEFQRKFAYLKQSWQQL